MRWKLIGPTLVVAALPVVVGILRTDWLPLWALILAPVILLLGRDRSRELLLAVSSIVVSMLLFDLVLRGFADDLLYPSAHARFVERRPEADDVHRYRAGSHHEGATKGDLTAMAGHDRAAESRAVRFDVDGRGYRNDGALAGKGVEVVVLGDSFGAGLGTTQDEGVAARLGVGRRVYNLSIGGAGPREELLTLELEIDRIPLAPGARLVWLLFEGNDLDEAREGRLEIHPYPTPRRRISTVWSRFRKRSPLRQLVIRVEAALFPGEEATHVRSAYLPNGDEILFFHPYDRQRSLAEVEAHPRYRAFADLFGRVVDRARKGGLSPLVVLVPTKARIYPTDANGVAAPRREPLRARPGFAAAVEGLCRQVGVEFQDLTPAFVDEAARAWKREELLWWRDDTHWNGRGHRLAASSIEARLRQTRR